MFERSRDLLAHVRPTDWAALGFVGLAIVCLVVDVTTTFGQAWTPNLGASCLEIAATIAIVDRIVRREATRRAAPLTESALRQLGDELGELVDALDFDIALSQALSMNDPGPQASSRPTAEVVDDALQVVSERRRSPDPEVEEMRLDWISDSVARAVPVIDRRIAVDRDALAPSLTAALEHVVLTLQRRGPVGGESSTQAYRYTRAVTNALGYLTLAAGAEPDVAKFLDDYVDKPRRERATIAQQLGV